MFVNVKYKGMNYLNLLTARIEIQPQRERKNLTAGIPWNNTSVKPLHLDHCPHRAGFFQSNLLGYTFEATDIPEFAVVMKLLILNQGHQFPAHGLEAIYFPYQGRDQIIPIFHPTG